LTGLITPSNPSWRHSGTSCCSGSGADAATVSAVEEAAASSAAASRSPVTGDSPLMLESTVPFRSLALAVAVARALSLSSGTLPPSCVSSTSVAAVARSAVVEAIVLVMEEERKVRCPTNRFRFEQ
jgi:hypothetical protein